MKKIAQKILLPIVILTGIESAFALDSGAQNLTANVGATDYFKINCAGDTDHLNFKLFEGAANSVIEKPAIPPQLFNATLTKLKLTATVSGVEAGASKEITLKGGNGAYTLAFNTFGTNLSIKTNQTYAVQYQCLNAKGKVTKGSSTLTKSGIESVKKTLANGKTAKYIINCAKDVTNGDTDSLVVKLINKTAVIKSASIASSSAFLAPSGDLTAQVIKAVTAKNTMGESIDVQQGSGKYDVLVNSPTNKALSYHFEYSCLNTKNVEAQTAPFQLLQDQ
jgi:hypothetical protein